jgi:hypothetical protein
VSLITVLGIISPGGPILSTDAEGQPECRFTLLVSGTSYAVALSSTHARWIASTVNSGTVVQVEGAQFVEGVVQAWQVDPVPRAEAAP